MGLILIITNMHYKSIIDERKEITETIATVEICKKMYHVMLVDS